ncbi:MAG: DUF4870 domain-containing protein [Phycisphaeraceae bacterium]|nr:DUF4870 domain-containing protein [Phycisphaeraceae bacterium]
MSLADELLKLEQLRKSGGISEEEFARLKAKLMDGSSDTGPGPASAPPPPPRMRSPREIEQQTRQWAMFIHLSQLLNFVLPGGGIVAPIVLWQIKKDELPGIDEHGKAAVNWVISLLIYAIVAGMFSFILIGIPFLFALAVLGIVFPIIAGLRAGNDGVLWNYPLSIPFIR